MWKYAPINFLCKFPEKKSAVVLLRSRVQKIFFASLRQKFPKRMQFSDIKIKFWIHNRNRFLAKLCQKFSTVAAPTRLKVGSLFFGSSEMSFFHCAVNSNNNMKTKFLFLQKFVDKELWEKRRGIFGQINPLNLSGIRPAATTFQK